MDNIGAPSALNMCYTAGIMGYEDPEVMLYGPKPDLKSPVDAFIPSAKTCAYTVGGLALLGLSYLAFKKSIGSAVSNLYKKVKDSNCFDFIKRNFTKSVDWLDGRCKKVANFIGDKLKAK